jgi:hypothetical protein
MKIKQYRNLFENWQRHLVEGEVEDEVLAIAAQDAENVTGEPPAMSGRDIEKAKKSIQNDLEFAKKEEQNILSAMSAIENDFGTKQAGMPESLDEKKKVLVEEDEFAEEDGSNRGGIEAQMALAKYLNEVPLKGGKWKAITNKKGSIYPDVTVIPKTVEADIYTDQLHELIKEDKVEVLARFEVKSSNSTREDNTFNVAFFDQTIGKGQLGFGSELEKYFGDSLKELAKKNNLYFYYEGEWTTAEEYLKDDVDAENVFDQIINYAYAVKKNKEGEIINWEPCGVYGELIAPKKSQHTYFTMSDIDKKYKDYYSGLDLARAESPEYATYKKDGKSKESFPYFFIHEKGKPTSGVSKDGKQLFFYHLTENVEGKKTPYYFKMTVAWTGLVDVDGKEYQGYLVTKPNIAKTRSAATSGKMISKCWSLKLQTKEKNAKNGAGEVMPGPVIKRDPEAQGIGAQVIDGVRKHWIGTDEEPKSDGDDYFVVVGRPNKDKPYEKMFVFTTGDKNPLNLHHAGKRAGKFTQEDMEDIKFQTYGLADVEQVRGKVGGKVRPKNALIVSIGKSK